MLHQSAATRHVDVVAVLFMLWGALTMLIGASTLALAITAAALTRSSGAAANGQFAAGLAVAAFATVAILALAWGVAHFVIGTRLRRLRPWSRMGALMLGSVDLVLLPFGTLLGAYSLWTLLREDARQLFEAV
jgi:hypothetical protein